MENNYSWFCFYDLWLKGYIETKKLLNMTLNVFIQQNKLDSNEFFP